MKGVYIQFMCAFFLYMICGMNSLAAVWPSYATRVLESGDSPLGFPMSQGALNLVGSIPMLGSLLSTVAAGYVTDAVGGKRAQLICGLFYAVAWSLIVSARSTFQVLSARFLMGLSMGLSSVSALIYVSEVTQLSVRGSTAVLGSLLYNCGIMLSYLEGWFWSYDLVCYVNLTCSVLYVVLICFLYESPLYLLKIGKEKEALKSLKFYRGSSETSEAVLEELSYMRSQRHIDTDPGPATVALSEKEKLQQVEKQASETTGKENAWMLLLKVAHNRRAVISSVTFVILSSAMGMVAVQTYASEFFSAAAPSVSPDLCSVVFSLFLVAANISSVAVMDTLPRRMLMISSCAVSTACLAALGAALRLPAGAAPGWVPLLAVLLYVLAFHLGVINIVFVQLSESYAPKVRSAAAVVVFSACFLTNFLVLFLFPPAVEYMGLDNTFFVFAGVGALTTLVSYLWTQETRRVPYHLVEAVYRRGIMYRRVDTMQS